MKGNVTEAGVRLELEWMQRVGIGGVQHFDAVVEFGLLFNTLVQVERPVVYLTPEWRQAMR